MKSNCDKSYRPDIDGLRAIAVLAVILYHADLPWFAGGYVGVDIFFMISGYLITSIIISEIDEGKFTIAGFYERRIRRIFPALFALCIATTVASALIFMPFDLREYGQSLASISFFLSNVLFYWKTGYFNEEVGFRPLLHTWSLAVEEQFYVTFPLLLVLLSRLGRRAMLRNICLLFAASFYASVAEVRHNPGAAFYLIWYRAWELLAGAIVAFRILPGVPDKRLASLISVFGLGMIAVAISSYNSETRFPGESALLPVLGAAACIFGGIYTGNHGIAFRILAIRPLVFIGLISYSLYLWHWPVFVMFKHVSLHNPLFVEKLLLIALAFLLAISSYYFIEKPLRKGSATCLQRRTAGAALTCMIATALWGTALHLYKGFPQRLPDDVSTLAMTAFDVNPKRKECDGRSIQEIAVDKVCTIGKAGVTPSFVLIGDSFADALSPGVHAMALERARQGFALTHGGCLPLIGVNQQDDAVCRQFVDSSMNFILRHPEIQTVLLVGRWTTGAEGTRFGVNKLDHLYLTDDKSTQRSYEENRRVMKRGFDRTLHALRKKRVFIVGFIPEQRVNAPRTVAMQRYLGSDIDLSVERSVFDSRQRFARQLIQEAARRPNVTLIDVGQYLCDSKRCAIQKDNSLLYVDDNHLSRTAAISLRYVFSSVFDVPS
jgi:peptidoglycan/LPS O-acetylase OafA/YrhL